MKEKTKKMLCGLGMATILGVGGLSLAGCSVELSEKQVDKVMSVVDRSDVFMDETIDLLERNNAELDRKDIVKLCELAKYKLLLNYNNIWDNLKASTETSRLQHDGSVLKTSSVIGFYKLNNINYSYTMTGENVVVGLYDSTGKYLHGNVSGTGDVYVHERNFTASSKTLIEQVVYFCNVTENNIVQYEVSKEGNYKVTICDEMEESVLSEGKCIVMVTLEIDNEGYLLGMSGIYDSNHEKDPLDENDIPTSENINVSLKIEKGVFTDEIMQGYITQMESRIPASE